MGIVLIFVFAILQGSANALTLKEIVGTKKGNVKKQTLSVLQGEKKSLSDVNIQKENNQSFLRFEKKDIEEKVQAELQIKYGENLEVRFAPWRLPGGKTGKITQFIVEKIEINQQQTKISATVHFQVSSKLKTIKVRGRLDHMIDVPTLNRPVHYGEIINAKDISWSKVSGRKSNRFLIMNPKELIGLQPRSGFLKVGVPIYQRDVERVRDVSKGSVVTLRYKSAKVELITKARALEHGYKGDTIRVLNLHTNKIIHGHVLGPNNISLTPDNM